MTATGARELERLMRFLRHVDPAELLARMTDTTRTTIVGVPANALTITAWAGHDLSPYEQVKDKMRREGTWLAPFGGTQ